MLNIQTILHPTDYSEHSAYAFRIACSLARDYQAKLVLLHVALRSVTIEGEAAIAPRSEEYFQAEREKLEGISVPTEIRVERQVVEGAPAEEILSAAQTMKADLIVMGTHGRTGLSRLLMGSVAEQVLRKAPCPVLTVRALTPLAEPAEALTSQQAAIDS
jgi:nucleotide-binding universal stress UspA family protein